MNIFNLELRLSDLFPWRKKPLTVLVVDDEASTIELIRTAAEAAGYAVEAATTAEEAIGILHANGRKFVVALVDVRLPGMSGWQLRRRILAHWPSLRTIVISQAPASFENMPQGEMIEILIKPANYGAMFRSLK